MFESALSPIRDMKGDDTINIVSTPFFPASPAPTLEPITNANTKLCMRLFEETKSDSSSSNDWTTDSSSNDWTTDSSSNDWTVDKSNFQFKWSATP
jgi:hypothetical protein